MKNKIAESLLILLLLSAPIFAAGKPVHHPDHIIIFVWDGLRPDAVTLQDTPTLFQFMRAGSQFTDNHASYPTFTMMNAASFATGDRAGKTGFFGNTLWHPTVTGNDSGNKPCDFRQPVFTEDYKLLQDLNKEHLLFVNTLFQVAHQKNLTTAAIGKSGPAFMQDYLSQGIVLDEKHVSPLSFAKQLQRDGYALPKDSAFCFNPGNLILKSSNGAPTDAEPIHFLADGVTPDPSDRHGSPYKKANQYMMKIYLNEILAKQMPTLSVIWMRDPDTTEHTYGPGTMNYHDALHSNDKMFAELLNALKTYHLDAKTDVIVVSDHAHSTVSGPLNIFPLRNIQNNKVGAIDAHGYSVSGEIRVADLLTKAGFHAFDGKGCNFDPVLSGIKADGKPLYETKVSADAVICAKAGEKYITPAYMVSKDNLTNDAIIVASNGGTDYFYIPSHNKNLVNNVITFLASHQQFDAIFVDGDRYGNIDGTIPLATIGIENPQGYSPDIVAGFSYDAKAKVNGLPGIEYSDGINLRGMHGSFSPVDVHNFLVAQGPDFRAHFADHLPSGNVDVAPTVAYLLGLQLPKNDGRILSEALTGSKKQSYKIKRLTLKATKPLQHLIVYDVLNKRVPQSQFTTIVYAKVLSADKNNYYYFDRAHGERK